jgi:hypothetical protein
MPLATGLPLSSGIAPVAVVKTITPTTSKESSTGQISYAVVVNIPYYVGNSNNALVPTSTSYTGNTSTLFPTTTLAVSTYGLDMFGIKQGPYLAYANTVVVTNLGYTIGRATPNNYIIPTSVNYVANTSTVYPLFSISENQNLTGSLSSPANTAVVTNVRYNLLQNNPNNYIIPISVNYVANTTTSFPTTTVTPQFLLSPVANAVVLINYQQRNQTLLSAANINITLVNTSTAYNTNTSYANSGSFSSYVVSRSVATFSNSTPSFFTTYLGSYRNTISSLVNIITTNEQNITPFSTTGNGVPVITSNLISYGSGFNSDSYGSSRISNNAILPTSLRYVANTITVTDFGGVLKGRTNTSSFTTNVISYGSGYNSTLLASASISNNAPGLTYVPAYTVTTAEVVNKPYTAVGFTSSVTFRATTLGNIISQYVTVNPLKIDTTSYANSIYLIRSGFATSFTNYYSTGGGFDPNSPYLGSSSAYWS